MIKLGITGGLGCGKSTVARLLERFGFRRIDSDWVVREKVLSIPAVADAIFDRFGAGVRGGDGKVDRAALARRVFARPEDRKWLEELVHPGVFSVWRTEFELAPESDWVVEVPLLFETGLENWFDFTVCVALSRPRQYSRLEQRGLSRELAEQRIAAQLLLATKLELADFVIWNDGSSAFLDAQVGTLASLIRSG